MKKLTSLLLIISSLLLNSCVSKYVKKDRKSYSETFYSYYVSEYGNDLVFIGEKYHYVFNRASEIAEIAKPEWKDKLLIDEINLSTNKDNEVKGDIKLMVSKSIETLKDKEIARLIKYGFIFEVGKNGIMVLKKKITLNGIRYEPEVKVDRDNKDHFTRSHTSKIKYELNSGEKVKKALITPIAVAADGIIIVAGVAFILLPAIVSLSGK